MWVFYTYKHPNTSTVFAFYREGNAFAFYVRRLHHEAETDDPDRRVDVEVWPPTGDDAHHIEFELPEAAVAAEVGFAIFRIEVNLPVDGRWVLVVTGGAGTISLPLIVTG
ncbi:hypothetical protein ABLN72_02700 [Mycobacterium tuberculosis]